MDAHATRFMEHALELARKGIGLASPNPMVGCILVREGQIVGEGFHQYDKRDHAEIVALKSAGEKARGVDAVRHAGAVQSHRPDRPLHGSHYAAGISRVVAAMEDPNPKTRGGGFARLRAAEIDVTTGLLEEDAQKINEGFACWITTRKPFVTLKSALTLDGQLALPNSRSGKKRQWITSEESRAEVQIMRHASDALLTGIGTILADDPLLTDCSGLPRRRSLLRVILDTDLTLSPKARIVVSAKSDVLVFTAASPKSPKRRLLQKAGVEVVHLKRAQWRRNVEVVLAELGKREVLSVLLEAGPTLNGAALAAGIVNKLVLFDAPKLAGDIGVPLAKCGKRDKSDLSPFRIRSIRQFGPDVALELIRQNN